VQIKYLGYINRQQTEVERIRRHEDTPLPPDLDYAAVDGLSHEVRQKLTTARPSNLALASRIPGVTPAAISQLLIHLKKQGALARSA
jgi:tRNA uridine 5-carboxymethylaminomethyl modification enzyme